MVLFHLLVFIGCSSPATEAPTETKVETPVPVAAPEAPKTEPVPAAPSKRVFFLEPAEGATVKSPVKLVFGLDGMALAPAGTPGADSGHHHVIVDGEPVPAGTLVPKDVAHIHFGKAETDTTLELAKGPHTLTLQLADGNHLSYGPEMSATIHVTAE